MDADFLILGAGPAGLMAAWTFARRRPNRPVVVVDRMSVAGAKLAVAGGGRGNLSHLATEEEFARAFGRQGRFAIPAYRALPPDRLRDMLAETGVATVVDAVGRIYPRSQSAGEVRDALAAACRRAGVHFVFNRRVDNVLPPGPDRGGWQADKFFARAILLAAGGRSAPQLGSDGSGWALAQRLGCELTPPVPALTGLQTVDDWPKRLSGLSLPDAALIVAGERDAATRGELLFTHRGVSGPVVLDLSGRVARRLLAEQEVRLELRLAIDAPNFPRLRQTAGTGSVRTWLARQMPRALAATLLELAGIPPEQTFSRLTAAQEKTLRQCLAAVPLAINGTGGFADSMVTSGGIRLRQVCPDTLESRIHPALYFAGEILDLDGPTGGWNLHWAFCSGHLAGLSAAR